MAAIALEQVSFAYPGPGRQRYAVHDVSCAVQKREICALVGASGSGKSTILRMIAGLQPPTAGSVIVDGREMREPSRRVGVVFQEYSRSLLPWRTVAGNIAMAFGPSERDPQSRAQVVDLIETVGLARVGDRYPWELSGGMQQRVAIARALALNSETILLDEPFGSVDSVTRFTLEDLVLKTAAQFGLTVLLVTHDLDEAIYMADRVLVMDRAGSLLNSSGIAIPFERPRDQMKTRGSQEFSALRDQLLGAVGFDRA